MMYIYGFIFPNFLPPPLLLHKLQNDNNLGGVALQPSDGDEHLLAPRAFLEQGGRCAQARSRR